MDHKPARPERSPRIWMDLTTSQRSAYQANGTTRIERSLARELSAALGDRLAFFTYRSHTLVPVPAPDFSRESGTASAPPRRGPGAKHKAENSLGRRMERALRQSVRRHLHELRKGGRTSDFFPPASPNDWIFLGGENWASRYDYGVFGSLRTTKGVRVAALCQDLIPLTHPQFFASNDFVSRYRAYVDFLLHDTDLIIAISRSTARELEALKPGRSSTRIAVVNPGADFNPSAHPSQPASPLPLSSEPFVVCVSTIQSRKNFDLLYRIWRAYAEEGSARPPRLVMVGQRGFGSDDLLWQIANDPAVRGSIAVLHEVSDDELAWLYQNCLFSLYPSFAEGWGLPISESLAYGKFCLASNTTSMPEAGQGFCEHLSPIDGKAWQQSIIELATNPERLHEHERRIRERYRPRTWENMARDISALMA